MSANNTTVYNMVVTRGAQTYTPSIHVADNGVWKITGAEAFRAALTADQYEEWLIDFWVARADRARK